MQKEETQFYDLLGLYLSGDATREEEALLKEFVAANEQYAKVFEVITKPAKNHQYHENVLEQAYAAHYVKKWLLANPAQQNADDDTSAPRNIKKSKRIYFYSATIAAIFLLIISFYFLQDAQQADKLLPQTVTTRKGDKRHLTLPDGTKVWLNADSRLSYDKNFSKKTREVTLTGEAFFDVSHDAKHPFILHAGKTNITVLGTAFNVRNYENEGVVEATLLRGKIQVTRNDQPDFTVIMKPADKLTITDSIKHESITPVLPQVKKINLINNVVPQTSWTKNIFCFEDKPLQLIAYELERQFNVNIVFKSTKTKKYRYTFFAEELSLPQMMQRISLLQKIKYTITEDNQIIIE